MKKTRYIYGYFFKTLTYCFYLGSSSWVFANPIDTVTTANFAQALYLDTILNQSPKTTLGHFIQLEDDLLISKTTLQNLALNIKIADQEDHPNFVSLKKIDGLKYQYDASNQTINLDASSDLLSLNTQVMKSSTNAPAIIDKNHLRPGILFNYDIHTQYNQDELSQSLWNELRFFGTSTGGFFSISANHLYTKNDHSSELNSEILDTYWQKDFQDQAISLTLGDSQSRALNWSRSTRISGLKIAKNYNLQPYQTTSPLESFKGSVLLPSSVDLLINGIQQSNTQVLPGNFDIQAIPTLTGAGNAQLVITDLNGQQRVVNFSLFGANNLLQKGLSDWDVNVGVNKLDYAVKSFSYDDQPLFSGSYRYGLSQDTTLESHAEFTDGLQLTGLGFTHRLPKVFGIVNGSYSYSRLDQRNGQLYNLGYQWNNSLFNISFDHQQVSEHYGDIASTLGYNYTRQSNRAFLGLNTEYGQFGASYVQQDYDQFQNEFLIFNWSHLFASKNYLNISMTRDLNTQNNSFYLSLNIPLDRQTQTAFHAQKNNDNNQFSANARRTALQNQDDWGWQAYTNFTNSDHYTLQGSVQRNNRFGEWELGIQNDQVGNQSYSSSMFSGRGSLLMMENHLFSMRQTLGSFAVVSTQGVPNVPVQLENRNMGKTNKKGLLLIDNINAYQHNDLSIDTLALPIDYKIETTRIDAVPYSGSGVYVEFPIYKMKSIQFNAIDQNNAALVMGSRVWNQDQKPTTKDLETTIVARDGIVYLENPKNSPIYIEQNQAICQLTLPELTKDSGFIDLGSLKCL
ncbi:MAG: fimbria/pilus outer membrane usher protein [Acinetobacter sp.]